MKQMKEIKLNQHFFKFKN